MMILAYFDIAASQFDICYFSFLYFFWRLCKDVYILNVFLFVSIMYTDFLQWWGELLFTFLFNQTKIIFLKVNSLWCSFLNVKKSNMLWHIFKCSIKHTAKHTEKCKIYRKHVLSFSLQLHLKKSC